MSKVTRKQLFETIREYVQEGPGGSQFEGVEDRKRTAVMALAEAVMWPAVKQTDTVTVDMLNAMNAYCHPKPICLRDAEGGAR